MLGKFLIKNLNVFSLILVCIGFILFDKLLIFSMLLFILGVPPLLFIMSICDSIINRESSILNLLFLVTSFSLYEYVVFEEDLQLYLYCLAFLLLLLMVYNFLRKNKICKNSSLFVLCFTIFFHIIISSPSDSPFTKNLITGKVGFYRKFCFSQYNCVEYKIPRQYNELKVLISGSYCPLFRAVKNGKVLFINHFNENIFPQAQEVEYVGRKYSDNILYFKVKENGKLGFYSYDPSICPKSPSDLNQNNAITKILEPKYDEITIVKKPYQNHTYLSKTTFPDSNYEVPLDSNPIAAIIVKNNDGYSMYISYDGSAFKLLLNNRKNIKYIDYVKNDDNDYYYEEHQFEIDGTVKTIDLSGKVKSGMYLCVNNKKLCRYNINQRGEISSNTCPLSGASIEDILHSQSCTYHQTRIKKYKCKYDSDYITIKMVDGKVISAIGNKGSIGNYDKVLRRGECKSVSRYN